MMARVAELMKVRPLCTDQVNLWRPDRGPVRKCGKTAKYSGPDGPVCGNHAKKWHPRVLVRL
jgi:hypothetical protein